MENSKKMERQKFFKKSHVETVETKNRIFVENGLGKIPDTQKNSQNFGDFVFPQIVENAVESLLKVCGKL